MTSNSLRTLLRWARSRLSLRRPLLRLILATAGCVGPSPEPDPLDQLDSFDPIASYCELASSCDVSAGK